MLALRSAGKEPIKAKMAQRKRKFFFGVKASCAEEPPAHNQQQEREEASQQPTNSLALQMKDISFALRLICLLLKRGNPACPINLHFMN